MSKGKNEWGIPAATARDLLERAGGKNILVREKPEGGAQHARRAILVDIVSEHTARVRPVTGSHRKTDDVPLSSLKFWKSANELNGVPLPMPALAEPPKKVSAPLFVILSRKCGGIWGGENVGWTPNPMRGISYEEANAKRASQALGRQDGADDAEVVAIDNAMQILGEMRGPATLPRPIETVKPAKHLRVSLSPLPDSLDIDAILEDDGTALQKAINDRKAAAQEVKDAQAMLSEAMAKLQAAQEVFARLMGRDEIGRVEEQAQDDKRGYTPRGALKGAVRKILSESSHLSMSSIVGKVMGLVDLKAGDPQNSIKQCLYSMKSAGEVALNDQGAYGLTSFGRERMKQVASSN